MLKLPRVLENGGNIMIETLLACLLFWSFGGLMVAFPIAAWVNRRCNNFGKVLLILLLGPALWLASLFMALCLKDEEEKL
jgi:Na+/H+ antiporter NhaC